MTTEQHLDASLWGWAPIELGERAATRVLDNGDVETSIDFLELVPQEQKGGAGKFDPRKWMPSVKSIFAEELAKGLQPPLVLGHPVKIVLDEATQKMVEVPDESAPAVGWVTGIEEDGTRARATVRLNADFALRVLKGEYKHCSPEISPYFDAAGQYRGAKFKRLGVTNTPHQKGLDGLPVAAFALSEVCPIEADRISGSTTPIRHETPAAGDHMMDETKLKELVDSAVTAQLSAVETRLTEHITKAVSAIPAPAPVVPEAALSDAAVTDIHKTIISLSEKLTNVESKVAEKDGEIAKLSETLTAQTAKLAESDKSAARGRIESTIHAGLRNCTLVPADTPGFGKPGFDAFAWLSESRFGGVDLGRSEANLLKHVATGRPVAGATPTTDRVSLPSSGHESIALAEVPFAKGAFADAAEFEKYASAGIGGDPRSASV